MLHGGYIIFWIYVHIVGHRKTPIHTHYVRELDSVYNTEVMWKHQHKAQVLSKHNVCVIYITLDSRSASPAQRILSSS